MKSITIIPDRSIKKLEMSEKRNLFKMAIEHYSSKPKELVL